MQGHERVPGLPDNSGYGAGLLSCCGPRMDVSIRLLLHSPLPPSPDTCSDGLPRPLQQMLCSAAAPHQSPVKTKQNPASCLWDTSLTMWQVAGEVWTEEGNTGGMWSCFHNTPFWISSWRRRINSSLSVPRSTRCTVLELLVFIAVPRRPIAQILLKEDIVLSLWHPCPGELQAEKWA